MRFVRNRLVRIFLLVLFIVLVFSSPALAAFSTPISLTPAGVGLFPSIDADSGGVVHAVWAEIISGNREIIYTKSTDGGASFPSANKRNISNSSLLSTSPKLKLDANDDIHIVWEEETANGTTDVFYSKSTNDGSTFSTPLNVSNNTTQSVSPSVETSGANRVYVAWTDEAENYTQIFLSRSTNSGGSFGSAVNVSNASYHTDVPVVVSRGGTVVIAWQSEGDENFENFGIYRVFSSDNGGSFGSVLRLSANTTDYVNRPKMAFDGAGRLHVVAQRTDSATNDSEVDYYRSTNSGQTFASAVNLSNTPSAGEGFPQVRAVGNDTVKVTYNADVCNETCTVATLEAESVNGGSSFAAAGTTDFATPSIEDLDFDVVGTTLHMIYQEGNTVKYKNGSR